MDSISLSLTLRIIEVLANDYNHNNQIKKQEKKNRIIFQLTVDFQRGRSVLYCEENSSILYIVGTNEHSARRVRYKLELFPTQSRANLSL